MIGKTISHYKILEKLGEGGMGIVYKAQDLKLKRKVALKFLPPDLTRNKEAKKRFIQEAQAASALDHNNICNIYEIGETEDDQIFIAMACYEGKTLKQKIEHGPLKVEEAVDIAVQITQGLSKAHEKDIVHRDIKPANIFITNDGIAKILDFGLAKLSGQARLTKTRTTVGTVAYMSPEQTKGEEVDTRTDIWSLGVVLYEMLTVRLPFEGEYEQSVIYSIINTNPKSARDVNSSIPEDLDMIVNRCLQKDPKDRYRNASELISDLEKQKGQIITGNTYVRRKLPSISRKLIWISGSVILTLVAALVVFLVLKPFGKKMKEISIQDMPSIAVMYFEDATGDEQTRWLSNGLPNMLITSLEQSPQLRVIGYQRLYDILKQLGKENIQRIDKTIATEIAKKANAKTMLLGSIFKWGNLIQVDYQLQDVVNGDLVFASKITGENPLTIADNLALEVRKHLETSHRIAEVSKVTDVTTHSIEAYRYYLQGKDLANKSNWKDSWKNYSKAIQLDSTFATTFLQMSDIATNVGKSESVADSLLSKAVEYAYKISERERLYIYARDAYRRGKNNQARSFVDQLIKKYPDYARVYLYRGLLFSDRRDYINALPYVKKSVELSNFSIQEIENLIVTFENLGKKDSVEFYIQKLSLLYPKEAITTEYLVYNYLRQGKTDISLKTALQAVNMQPKEPWVHRWLGIAYLFSNRFDSAETAHQRMGALGWKADEIEYLSILYSLQGKSIKTFNYLNQYRMNDTVAVHRKTNTVLLNLFDFLDNKDSAREAWLSLKDDRYQQFLSGIRRGSDAFFADSLLRFKIPDLYYNGKIDEALYLCNKLDEEIKRSNFGGQYQLDASVLRASILYSSKQFAKASKIYETCMKEDPKIFYQYRLAHCYYLQKQFKEALNILLHVNMSSEPRLWRLRIDFGYAYPRTRYLLGLVNEALGKNAEAINAYQEFLEIWKNADPDLPELIDAKARLVRLTSGDTK